MDRPQRTPEEIRASMDQANARFEKRQRVAEDLTRILREYAQSHQLSDFEMDMALREASQQFDGMSR